MNKDINDIQDILKQKLPDLRAKYRIDTIGLFGSFVREEQSQNSDIDILVTFNESPSLFKFIELENYLSQLLGRRVDLVMQSALKPQIAEQITKEIIQL